MLFLQELEKEYILLTDESVRRHHRLMLTDSVWILLNDEYGSTKYLNMNISEDELEKIMKEIRDNDGFFGYTVKILKGIGNYDSNKRYFI